MTKSAMQMPRQFLFSDDDDVSSCWKDKRKWKTRTLNFCGAQEAGEMEMGKSLNCYCPSLVFALLAPLAANLPGRGASKEFPFTAHAVSLPEIASRLSAHFSFRLCLFSRNQV
jgi:hypothetical protein